MGGVGVRKWGLEWRGQGEGEWRWTWDLVGMDGRA